MAQIEKTAFEVRVSNNRKDELANITGHFRTEQNDDVCPAGLLCVKDGQLPCAGFAGVFNENAWYMKAAAKPTANDVVYAANSYESNQITDAKNGNTYHIGEETLGLAIPKGEEGTFTVIRFDGEHVYAFGEGNLSAEISDKKFVTIADGKWVPAQEAPKTVGALYGDVLGTGNFTEGTANSFGYVLIQPRVVAAAGE